ncbi:MAG: AraC family transcriptional regulator [Pseudomonadota bacterium]
MTDMSAPPRIPFLGLDIFPDAGLTHVEHADAATMESIKPSGSEIAASRFTIGNHGSEIAPSDKATLILSNESDGHLHAKFSGSRMEGHVRPGTLTFVPADVSQQYEFRGKTTNIALAIDQGLLERVANTDPLLGSVDGLEPRGFFIRPSLQKLVEDQYQIMASGEAGWRVLSESTGLRIAYELLTMFNGAKRTRTGTAPLSQRELEELLDFIDGEMESNFGLNEMAATLDRDPFGFSRAFKAATGESPHQFVIHRRLARVKDMLSRSRMPLAEISYATGFASQSHMTATFSKHFGLPPGQYRRLANR